MIAIMEKIILKDGTEYEIITGATNYTFAVMVKNMIEVSRIVEKLTTENLSSFTLQLGYTTLIVTNKALNTVSASPDEAEDFPAHFELRDVSTTEIEIRDGRARVISSPCRNGICMEAGWSGTLCCLPNKIIATTTADEGALDAISG